MNDFELRPLPAPWVASVPGPCWLITLGEPPRTIAVAQDPTVAERLCDLLNTNGLIDADALTAIHPGDTP